MIKLNTLSEQMEEELNTAAEESRLQDLFPNTEFRFRVVLDTADYKAPERSGNTVTYYINAIMRVISSESEGESAKNYNSSMLTSVDFLIPIIGEMDENGEAVIVSEVRYLLGSTLQNGKLTLVEDPEDGTQYLKGAKYLIASTGNRAVREKVGDSIILSITADYVFITSGVASSAYKFYIVQNDEREEIYFASFGLNRTTAVETNLSADETENGGTSAKSTPLNTVLAISLAAPVRRGIFDRMIAAYLVSGLVMPYDFEIEIPNYSASLRTKLIISKAAIGGQLNLAAADTVDLTEYMEV
jgi:hypothetical protein